MYSNTCGPCRLSRFRFEAAGADGRDAGPRVALPCSGRFCSTVVSRRCRRHLHRQRVPTSFLQHAAWATARATDDLNALAKIQGEKAALEAELAELKQAKSGNGSVEEGEPSLQRTGQVKQEKTALEEPAATKRELTKLKAKPATPAGSAPPALPPTAPPSTWGPPPPAPPCPPPAPPAPPASTAANKPPKKSEQKDKPVEMSSSGGVDLSQLGSVQLKAPTPTQNDGGGGDAFSPDDILKVKLNGADADQDALSKTISERLRDQKASDAGKGGGDAFSPDDILKVKLNPSDQGEGGGLNKTISEAIRDRKQKESGAQ